MEQFTVFDLKTTGEGLGLLFFKRKSEIWLSEIIAYKIITFKMFIGS